jgi:hypothetical protein
MWGCASKSLLHRLQILQKRAVRIIDAAYFLSHTDPKFKKFNLLKLADVYFVSCSLFLYKFKLYLLPGVCSNLLIFNDNRNDKYKLRRVYDFDIPPYRTSLREKCLKVRGPSLWRSISDYIKKHLILVLPLNVI